MRIYISHTAKCTGWNPDEIYKNTHFSKAARTMRYPTERGVKMLDWDYNQFLKFPEKVKHKHLRLVKEYDFEVVMSMDYWGWNHHDCLNFTDELGKYADRVLIPIHALHPELLQYELAYPNANWLDANIYVPGKYRDHVTHLLGGSPHAQWDAIHTKQLDLNGDKLAFQNIESVDGNQIFNVAIKSGKYWQSVKPHWIKPDPPITNECAFTTSVQNVEQLWHPYKL